MRAAGATVGAVRSLQSRVIGKCTQEINIVLFFVATPGLDLSKAFLATRSGSLVPDLIVQ